MEILDRCPECGAGAEFIVKFDEAEGMCIGDFDFWCAVCEACLDTTDTKNEVPLDPMSLHTLLDVYGKLLHSAARLTPLFGHESHPAFEVYRKTYWATTDLHKYLKENYPDELAKWFENS